MDCPQCGHKLITATGEISSFEVDSEPYEAGVIEDSGFDFVDEFVEIGILWCPECCRTCYAWIAEGLPCGLTAFASDSKPA